MVQSSDTRGFYLKLRKDVRVLYNVENMNSSTFLVSVSKSYDGM